MGQTLEHVKPRGCHSLLASRDSHFKTCVTFRNIPDTLFVLRRIDDIITYHLAACSKEFSVSNFLAQALYRSKRTGSRGDSRTLANAIASLKTKRNYEAWYISKDAR